MEETRHKRIESSNVFSPFSVCARGGFPLIDRWWSRDLILAAHPLHLLAFIGLPFSPFFIGFPPKKVNGTRKLMKGRKSNTFDFFVSFICARLWNFGENLATLRDLATQRFEECAKCGNTGRFFFKLDEFTIDLAVELRSVDVICDGSRCCHIWWKWKHVYVVTAE